MFVHEKQLGKYEKDENKREELIKEFGSIVRRLNEVCEKGIIGEYTKSMLIDMSKKVIRNLLGEKYPKVREEVEKYWNLKREQLKIKDG